MRYGTPVFLTTAWHIVCPTTGRRTIVVIAQALGEYVAVSAISAAFWDAWSSLQFYLTSLDGSTWLIVGGCVALVCILWMRFSY
jgi:hypothetical protein